MTTAIAHRDIDPAVVERVITHGDLSKLTSAQKVSYYNAVCESVGLNPLTQPFQYLVLNGKEILYARREATEQLRKVHAVSIQIRAREVVEDCYVVTAQATLPSGRHDENIGAVSLANLRGEARANAMMKAETKAKRRVTLAICGLGLLDETEVETIAAVNALPTHAPEAGGTSDNEETALLPAGVYYIRHVSSSPTRNPNVTRWVVTLSDHEDYSTINEPLGKLCEQLWQDHTPVTAETQLEGKYRNLLSVQRWAPAPEGYQVAPPVAKATEPITAASISF